MGSAARGADTWGPAAGAAARTGGAATGAADRWAGVLTFAIPVVGAAGGVSVVRAPGPVKGRATLGVACGNGVRDVTLAGTIVEPARGCAATAGPAPERVSTPAAAGRAGIGAFAGVQGFAAAVGAVGAAVMGGRGAGRGADPPTVVWGASSGAVVRPLGRVDFRDALGVVREGRVVREDDGFLRLMMGSPHKPYRPEQRKR